MYIIEFEKKSLLTSIMLDNISILKLYNDFPQSKLYFPVDVHVLVNTWCEEEIMI